ncbi:hypothetical protein ACWDYH_20245 [Nocardia goodfellowii]
MNARDEREARIGRAAASVDRILGEAHKRSRSAAAPNERFAAALAASGLTVAQLADKVRVDRKTVERWISLGRTPYPEHQFAVEKAIGVKASELWEPRRGKPPLASPEKENQRLRQAVFEASMTHEQLAKRLELNPKTIERWITKGHVPYYKHQLAAAVAVGVPAHELWPVPVRPELLALEDARRTQPTHETASPAGATAAPPSCSPVSPRMRQLMSWIDDRSPVKEHDIPRQSTERNYHSYSRSHGVERAR